MGFGWKLEAEGLLIVRIDLVTRFKNIIYTPFYAPLYAPFLFHQENVCAQANKHNNKSIYSECKAELSQ
jgi:hypothetical protein